MNRWTAFFLILLRLAIGWHFFFEGVQKLQSVYVGPTQTNRPFSSAGYFREAPGPLGHWYRQIEGDPDDKLLALLDVQPVPEGQDPATYKPHLRMPPALKESFDRYRARFATHYGLSEDQQKLLDPVQQQAESDVVTWLTYAAPDDPKRRQADPLFDKMVSKESRKGPSGVIERPMTMAQRIDEYKAQLAEVRDSAGRRLWVMGKDVEGPRLREAKANLATLRNSLSRDLDKKAAEYHKALTERASLSEEQKARGELKPVEEAGLLKWIDLATMWGLTVMGACLLLGLLTRLNCFLAGTFLLMTYLAFPSLPWVPAAPASEGNYLFVNKNVVEMLALFVLMTTASGRWFGLDAIVHRLLWGAEKQPEI